MTSLSVLGACLVAPQAAMAATLVDQILLLSWDISNSVSTAEYNLQRSGYANAFLNDQVLRNSIIASPNGIAVGVSQWASTDNTFEIPFVLLKTAADITNFGNTLANLARGDEGGATCVGCGIAFGINQITATQAAANGFIINAAGRLTIDVSGDGIANINNTGAGNGSSTTGTPQGINYTEAQRNLAAAAGITVNGLPIEGDTGAPAGALTSFYTNSVKTADGFVLPATSVASFDAAVLQKLRIEIVPAPFSFLALTPLFAFTRKLRKRASGTASVPSPFQPFA